MGADRPMAPHPAVGSARLGLVFAIVLLLGGGACLESEETCVVPGSEGCPCTSGGGCDPGLSCQSGVCQAGTASTPPGDPQTADGVAHVRFCHALSSGMNAPATITLEIAGQRLEVAGGTCGPAPGKSCLAVPAGPLQVKTTGAGLTADTRRAVLEPGKAYMFWAFNVYRRRGEEGVSPSYRAGERRRLQRPQLQGGGFCGSILPCRWSPTLPTVSRWPSRKAS